MYVCVICGEAGEVRDYLVNEYDEHDVLCDRDYIEVFEGLSLQIIPDCPSKGKGFRNYRINPLKMLFVEKVVTVVTEKSNTKSIRKRRRG